MMARGVAIAAAFTAALACGEARAQAYGYVSGPNSYTIIPGATGTYNPGSIAGISNGPSFMVGSSIASYNLPGAYPGYGGYLPYAGGAYGAYGGYFPQGYYGGIGMPGSVLYPGYQGYRGYGFLSYGRGRTFGAYPPRYYPTYQPRPFGRFDR